MGNRIAVAHLAFSFVCIADYNARIKIGYNMQRGDAKPYKDRAIQESLPQSAATDSNLLKNISRRYFHCGAFCSVRFHLQNVFLLIIM